MNRRYSAFAFTASLAAIGLVFAASAQNRQNNNPQGAKHKTAMVSTSNLKAGNAITLAAEGPSWLKHLGLAVGQTHMGQMGGSDVASSAPGKPQLTPAASAASLKSVIQRFLATFRSNPAQASEILNETFVASGADLYRWNCQACHGPEGKGALPEINSVLGPVQGTSAALTKKRMEARGIDADDDMVKQVSELAEVSLRDRLQHGGKSMPSFEYLRADEADALLGYLEKLAAVPPTERAALRVPESAARVGQQILRGTCHICHDATGPGAGESDMLQGVIPSLTSISKDHSLSGIMHQVQYGSSDMMRVANVEVMPAYPYFTQEEIAAVYLASHGQGSAAHEVAATRAASQ